MNKTEIRLISLARSGLPSIAKWLESNGKYCYLNCADSSDPFLSAQFLSNGQQYKANYDLNFEAECSGKFSDKDYFIHSYIDQPVKQIQIKEFEDYHDELVGESERRIDILILRDPFSLFANITRVKSSDKTLAHDINIWKQHAYDYLKNDTLIRINFNSWADSMVYRIGIAEQLGINKIDTSHVNLVEKIKEDNIDFLKVFDEEVLLLSNQIFGT